MRYIFSLVILSFFGISCSSEEPKLSKVGESCTVSGDCETGLACRTFVCVGTKVVPDGGTSDADMGSDDMSSNNNSVEDEDYVVSYILESSRIKNLFAFDTKTKKETKVNPENISCALGCWLSGDTKTFLFVTQNGPAFDLKTLKVKDLVAEGTPKVLQLSVRGIVVRDNIVSYTKGTGGETKAYYTNLSDGSEKEIGTIGTSTGTIGTWFVEPNSKKKVVFKPTLNSLDVVVGNFGNADEETYTIDSSNYQESAGSYFGSNIPTDITKDGKVMAVLTQSAPLNYNSCDNDSQCTQGPGQICGFKKRCSAIEVAVHFFDLSKLDNLGAACSADDTCGPIHTCDIPAEDQVDKAVCVPRQVKLGLPGQQTQGNPTKTGCELTNGVSEYYYTLGRSLHFGPDDKLYLAAERNCKDQNVPDSGVIELSPTSKEVKVAFSVNAGGFNSDDCYDNTEKKVSVKNCNPYVSKALLSPKGNDIIFMGTNPNVVDFSLAKKHIDLWRVKRNGKGKEWLGQHGELDIVKDIRVH